MAHVSYQSSHVRFKIVYCGPGRSGKTTNLSQLNAIIGVGSKIVSVETQEDRAVCFEYLPLSLGRIDGLEVVFKLYSVPGQERFNRTRRMVLRDVDGLVFVADSAREAMPQNVASLRSLEENLVQEGLDPAAIPMILQYNKRDLDEVSAVEELNQALNRAGRQWFEATASEGRNVESTFSAIVREVYRGKDEAGASFGNDTWTQALEERDEGGEYRSDDAFAQGDRSSTSSMVTLQPFAAPADRRTYDPNRPSSAADRPLGDDRTARQLVSLREILEQIAMTQAESEQLIELRGGIDRMQGELMTAIGRIAKEMEASRKFEEQVSARLAVVEAKTADLVSIVEAFRADIRREVSKDVDRYLAEFVEMADPLIRPKKEAEVAPIAASASKEKRVVVGGAAAHGLRETNAPPRRKA